MLYNRGVGLIKVQRLLGHKSVTTTELYLGVKFEETREAIMVLDRVLQAGLADPNDHELGKTVAVLSGNDVLSRDSDTKALPS